MMVMMMMMIVNGDDECDDDDGRMDNNHNFANDAGGFEQTIKYFARRFCADPLARKNIVHRFSSDEWRYKEGQKEWNVEKHFMRMEECIRYANRLRGSPSSAIDEETKKDILFGSFLVEQQRSFLRGDPDKYHRATIDQIKSHFCYKSANYQHILKDREEKKEEKKRKREEEKKKEEKNKESNRGRGRGHGRGGRNGRGCGYYGGRYNPHYGSQYDNSDAYYQGGRGAYRGRGRGGRSGGRYSRGGYTNHPNPYQPTESHHQHDQYDCQHQHHDNEQQQPEQPGSYYQSFSRWG